MREDQSPQDLAFMDEAVLMVSPHSPSTVQHAALTLIPATATPGRGGAPRKRDPRWLRPRPRRPHRRPRPQPHKRRPQRDPPRRVRRPAPPPPRPVPLGHPAAREALHPAARRRPRRLGRRRPPCRPQSVADPAEGRRAVRHGRAVPHVRVGHAPGRHREGLLRVRQRPLWRHGRRPVDPLRVSLLPFASVPPPFEADSGMHTTPARGYCTLRRTRPSEGTGERKPSCSSAASTSRRTRAVRAFPAL